MVYQRKVPYKNNRSKMRFHYTRKKGKWKPKKEFPSQEEAQAFIAKYKMTDYVAYLCTYCGHWHIGKKE